VVLLHGWGASSKLFEQTMAGLQDTFSVVAPDFPGFGATPPPPDAWSVGDYAEWVIQLLDSLDLERVHLIGHSFGGRVAIKLASQWPERVDKLVLTGSAGIRPPRSALYWVRLARYKTVKRVAGTTWLPPALSQWASSWMTAQGSADFQQASGTLRSSFVRIVNEDLRDLLPQIKAPTLLIWGERDEDAPLADGRLMEQLIPDAGLVVFEGAGHYAYLEQSARFCHIVRTFFRGAL
jgi:pimeloyl-ACP methyl ester carboxylesterase